jgi:hypothetical protein
VLVLAPNGSQYSNRSSLEASARAAIDLIQSAMTP